MTACESQWRSTKAELQEKVFAAFERSLDPCDPAQNVRRTGSNLNVVANVIAGMMFSLEAKADADVKQRSPITATASCLDDFAEAYCSGVRRGEPTQASGLIVITGTPGAVVPAGAVLTQPNGTEYTLDASATIAANRSIAATVTALLPGTAGNLPGGANMQFDSVNIGVNARVSVDTSGISGGAEQETDDALRVRVLQCLQTIPSGGSCTDYERWALEEPGVTRVWVQGGPGSVKIYFTMDGTYPDRNGIPLPSDADRMQSRIFGDPGTANKGLAPIGLACGYVCTPRPKPVDICIDQLEPNTAEVRQAVADNIRQWFASQTTLGGKLCRSNLQAAISAAAGECCHTLLEPAADLICGEGELPIPGTITFKGGEC